MKRPAEPLPVAVARAVFFLLVSLVGTLVMTVILLNWQVLVAGLGVTLVAFGYLALEVNQAQRKPPAD